VRLVLDEGWTVGAVARELDLTLLPANQPHAVHAPMRAKLLLTTLLAG
jgi:hypothetical protein